MSTDNSRAATERVQRRDVETRKSSRGYELYDPENELAWLASDTTVPLDAVQ